ncbi:SDR family NAD(P)-dependent oxidoreductase [Synechococcus sp. CCY 9618]|uniref:SDR family NAD(P)-dependent oxidoreductase n=1 Tax=Synechococcus sp. CCY 9618 TaxID=2815602 RepID=UPI001C216B89
MAEPRRLLLTGANSGIGFEAAVLLCRAGHRLTLLCRDQVTAEDARQQVISRAGAGSPPATVVGDLGDLESVRAAAAELMATGNPIDTLVLNAGLQYAGSREPRRTPQGHELTFAVNHLGHFLLAQRLLPLLEAGRAPRVVVTASEVHDPASAGGRVGPPAGLGDLGGLVDRAGEGVTMVDGSAFSADKAYKDSKLCNVLFAREWARRLEARGTPWPVIAWSPGLVIPPTSTGGFWRYSRQGNELGQRLFALAARSLLRLTESVENAGALLAALASDDAHAAGGFRYLSNRLEGPGRHRFEACPTSGEAQDEDLARRLWEASAALVGVEA